jgi:hypothetical protein
MPRIGRRQMSGFFTQNLTTFAGLPIGSAVIRDELDDDSFKGCCQGNERSSLGLAKMPLKVAIVSRPRPWFDPIEVGLQDQAPASSRRWPSRSGT